LIASIGKVIRSTVTFALLVVQSRMAAMGNLTAISRSMDMADK
jgi:hypothetical protein